MARQLSQLVLSFTLFTVALSLPLSHYSPDNSRCHRTQVIVLGAGAAGISAAQALSDSSVTDFLILEYNSEIGGRVKNVKFGTNPNTRGNYTVEVGANWIHGTGSPGKPENPIWRMVKKYNVANQITDGDSLLTYDTTGQVDYKNKRKEWEDDYEKLEHTLVSKSEEPSFRSGLNVAHWKPRGDPQAQAVEWYEFDYEYAQSPDVSSEKFSLLDASTYEDFSKDNQMSIDQRGYNQFLHGQKGEFMKEQDPRLILNTNVIDIDWNNEGVTIWDSEGSCYSADYAINTFSVGVLQSEAITFHPELPAWKRTAIETFQMGIYTKVFIQFPPDKVFWNTSVEFFLYASPTRGYFPVWQSLDHKDFLPGSGIIFATVVTDQSQILDRQDDETTKEQALVVLREMFGKDNVPEPTAFMYHRWSKEPWAYGSYSNWPAGMTLEGHQNLRANTGRVWYAGEATSNKYYGYLQGAYFEGKEAGESVAACIPGSKSTQDCADQVFYDGLPESVREAYEEHGRPTQVPLGREARQAW